MVMGPALLASLGTGIHSLCDPEGQGIMVVYLSHDSPHKVLLCIGWLCVLFAGSRPDWEALAGAAAYRWAGAESRLTL